MQIYRITCNYGIVHLTIHNKEDTGSLYKPTITDFVVACCTVEL